jgi:hypothetical protein
MTRRIILGAALVLLFAAMWVAADDKPWFDMEHCQMCKNFTQHEGLMEAMTWEQHKISGGFIAVSTTDTKHLEACRKANAACDALGEKLMAGEEVALCGSCNALGMAMAHGAKMENVDLENGRVMLVTSGDSTVIAGLHVWVDRNVKEMEKMMGEQEKPEGH